MQDTRELARLMQEKAELVSAKVSTVAKIEDAFHYAADLCATKEACQLLFAGCASPLSEPAEALCETKAPARVIAAPGLDPKLFKKFKAICDKQGINLISEGLRQKLAGIDIGTTGCKATVFSEKGKPLRLEDVGDTKYNKAGNATGFELSPTSAAHWICRKMYIAMSEDSDDIFRFDGQIYRPDGARIIDIGLCGLAGDEVDIKNLKEVLRRVRNTLLGAPVRFDSDPLILPVKNGVVRLDTCQFREYRPEDFITEQLDVVYDETARCGAFLAFLESITPSVADRLMLIDWFVATAIKEPLAYVLFLLGLGRNGKGIYEKLIKKYFGMSAFRDMPLQAIEKSDFAAGAFYRKRGWIASETGKKDKKNPLIKVTIS
jgi:hypothetical protein